MSENITITFTDQSEEITITLNENARGPAGSDATVTTAAVRAAVPNIVEVSSPSNDEFIQRVGGSWVTRTIAQVRTALGLGTAAYTASTDYAAAVHTHVSADITDAVNSTDNNVGDQDKIVKRSSGGGISGFSVNAGVGGLISTGDVQTSSDLVISDGVNVGRIKIPTLTGVRNWTGQDKDGTIAYTNDAAMTDERNPTTIVVSSNQTASNGVTYNNVASATYTDPSPVEGKGYDVLVVNGTATVGGTGYSTAGTLIKRRWHSGSWQTNYVYLNKAQMDAIYLSNAATAKTTPVDADSIGIVDSAASNAPKLVTWLNAWTNYFKGKADALYVALTGNQTIAGNKTFSGQTELTGQAATNSTSAMTKGLVRDDLFLNIGSQYTSPCSSYVLSNSGSGASAVNNTPAQTRLTSGTATSGYANADIAYSPNGIAFNIRFDRPSGVAIRLGINKTTAADTLNKFRLVWGGDYVGIAADLNAFSNKGFGMEIESDGANHRFRAICHDGSSYYQSSWVNFATGNITPFDRMVAIETDGAGNMTAYVSGDAGATPYYTATLATAPTGTGSGSQAGVQAYVSNNSTGSPTSVVYSVSSAVIKAY